MLTVLMHHLHLDLSGALNWVAEYHSSVQTKFLSTLSTLPSFGPEIDKDVRRYIDGLAYWVRANECWSFECARYFGEKGREYQRTRTIALFPKKKVEKSKPAMVGVTLKEEVAVPIVEELEVEVVAQ